MPAHRFGLRRAEGARAHVEFRDYYKVLGLERKATADQIRTAYRRLARKYHPDVSQEPNAEARFKEMEEACEGLRDPEKRAGYDQLGSEWRAGQPFRPPPDWGSGFEFGPRPRGAPSGAEEAFAEGGFSDFFSSLFGGATPFAAGGRRAARDHHARIDIELEEAFRGATRMLELKRPEVKAGGSLEVHTHTVRVTIPPGVSSGQLIRLAGQGEPAHGSGSAGDLYLEVHVRPHRLFQLDCRDRDLPAVQSRVRRRARARRARGGGAAREGCGRVGACRHGAAATADRESADAGSRRECERRGTRTRTPRRAARARAPYPRPLAPRGGLRTRLPEALPTLREPDRLLGRVRAPGERGAVR